MTWLAYRRGLRGPVNDLESVIHAYVVAIVLALWQTCCLLSPGRLVYISSDFCPLLLSSSSSNFCEQDISFAFVLPQTGSLVDAAAWRDCSDTLLVDARHNGYPC